MSDRPIKLLLHGLAALLLLLSINGCAELDALRQAHHLSTGDASPQGQVAEVLAYVRYVDGLRTLDAKPARALQSEYQTLDRVVREGRRPANRVKLAWLIALPGIRFQDSNRSLKLLANVTKEFEPGPNVIHDLIGWMRSVVTSQRDSALKLRRTRARLRVAQGQNEDLQLSTQSMQEQVTDLQQKINALTNIETGIDDSSYP